MVDWKGGSFDSVGFELRANRRPDVYVKRKLERTCWERPILVAMTRMALQRFSVGESQKEVGRSDRKSLFLLQSVYSFFVASFSDV